MENLLLLLAVAACPLMMWLMMRSMHHNKGEQETQPADDRQETARLKDEVAHLSPDPPTELPFWLGDGPDVLGPASHG